MNSTPAIRYAAWTSEYNLSVSIVAQASFRNMEIIRPATPNPPKMLIEATVAAMKASTTTSDVRAAELQQRADQDDPGDRVRLGHQRGVQRRADVGDHVEADEHRQHEHGEVTRGSSAARR